MWGHKCPLYINYNNSGNTDSSKLKFDDLKFSRKKRTEVSNKKFISKGVFGPQTWNDTSKFLKTGNSCHQYFLILILIPGSINKSLKPYFYLEYISGFLLQKWLKKSFFCTELWKLKKCRKNSSKPKFDVIKNNDVSIFMTSELTIT